MRLSVVVSREFLFVTSDILQLFAILCIFFASVFRWRIFCFGFEQDSQIQGKYNSFSHDYNRFWRYWLLKKKVFIFTPSEMIFHAKKTISVYRKFSFSRRNIFFPTRNFSYCKKKYWYEIKIRQKKYVTTVYQEKFSWRQETFLRVGLYGRRIVGRYFKITITKLKLILSNYSVLRTLKRQ